ncbi:MAG: hypothetical protein HZC48_02730 [Nitrospirae bacterium]|nr:hypothetical protein [Nitrospirota bacterium]
MKFRIIFPLIYILFALMIISGAGAEALNSKEELLESELELAQKPQIYFMLNSSDKKIYFKARGIILKEIPVDDIKFWGYLSTIKPYTMVKRSSFSTPVRDKINLEESDEEEKKEEKKDTKEKFQLKALELSDMPVSYTLSLDDNLFISVSLSEKGKVSSLYSAAYSLNWYLSRPLYTVWNTIKKKPYTAINLRLKKEDAQSLYWSFVEGGKIIIY